MIDKLEAFIANRAAKRDERGASAVEYGLLIAGIAALIVIAVFALGPVVEDAFSKTCDEMTSSPSTLDGDCPDDAPADPEVVE